MSDRSGSITAFEAKNRLGGLLDRVQNGEELIITRHGKPVAKLVPIPNGTAGGAVQEALATFGKVREALRLRRVKVSRNEVRKWIDEGRR